MKHLDAEQVLGRATKVLERVQALAAKDAVGRFADLDGVGRLVVLEDILRAAVDKLLALLLGVLVQSAFEEGREV